MMKAGNINPPTPEEDTEIKENPRKKVHLNDGSEKPA